MYNFPIEQLIKNQISVEAYFDIMHQLLLGIEETRREDVQMVLDLSRMSLKDDKLQYEVERVDGVYELAEIKNFIRTLTFACIFDKGENCMPVTKFLQTADSVSEVNFFQVMIRHCETALGMGGSNSGQLRSGGYAGQPQAGGYSGNLQSDGYAQPQGGNFTGGYAQQPGSGSGRLQQGGYQAQYVAGGNDGETGVLDGDFWQKLESSNQGRNQAQDPYRNQYQDQYQDQYQNYEQPNSSNGETGVLDPNFWNKISQGTPGGNVPKASTARLVHARTGNVVVINKENFWIGKGEVDLKIDKDVVSRRHAQIIARQNHYFIYDNDSTNKTYVDGKEIPPKASVELYNGTKVKFANEEYIFQI